MNFRKKAGNIKVCLKKPIILYKHRLVIHGINLSYYVKLMKHEYYFNISSIRIGTSVFHLLIQDGFLEDAQLSPDL